MWLAFGEARQIEIANGGNRRRLGEVSVGVAYGDGSVPVPSGQGLSSGQMLGICGCWASISRRLPILTVCSVPSSIKRKTATLLRPVMSQNSAIEYVARLRDNALLARAARFRQHLAASPPRRPLGYTD